MAVNHQRVTEGFQTLTEVLAPYVARELRAKFGEEWWDMGVLRVLHDNNRRDLPADGEDEELVHRLDAARCLILIDVQWDDLFRRKLSREHRTWIKELMATRNKWAHKGLLDMADEDAWRALDTMTGWSSRSTRKRRSACGGSRARCGRARKGLRPPRGMRRRPKTPH